MQRMRDNNSLIANRRRAEISNRSQIPSISAWLTLQSINYRCIRNLTLDENDYIATEHCRDGGWKTPSEIMMPSICGVKVRRTWCSGRCTKDCCPRCTSGVQMSITSWGIERILLRSSEFRSSIRLVISCIHVNFLNYRQKVSDMKNEAKWHIQSLQVLFEDRVQLMKEQSVGIDDSVIKAQRQMSSEVCGLKILYHQIFFIILVSHIVHSILFLQFIYRLIPSAHSL